MKQVKCKKVLSQPESYPTTSDISMFMQELGYRWSNEAQVYYDFNFESIRNGQARKLYKYFIGDKPYTKLNNIEKQIEELANFLMKEYAYEMGNTDETNGEGAIEMAIRLLKNKSLK